MTEFNEDYYERGIETGLSCYQNYRWLPELTIPMAEAIVRNLGLTRTDGILDFGCAKGYLVKALRDMGFLAYGCDVSDYALGAAPEDVKKYLCKGMPPRNSDWIICKDVLEHIPEKELPELLKQFRRHTEYLFVVVPLGNNGEYTIPEMELDVTHRIRRPLWWWAGEIEAAGFKSLTSSFAMKGIKENWTRRYQFGNGFIVAK